MSKRPALLLSSVLFTALAALSVSCSNVEDGVARPTVSEGASTVETAPARPVNDPLDISAYLSKPCDLVSPDMLDKFETSPESGSPRLPEDDDVAAQSGPYCGWPIEPEGRISVMIASGNTERGMGGLRGLQSLREQGRFELWEETSVAGYPAVYLGVRDARAEGDCGLAIGIAEDMTFGVTAHSFYDNPQRACDVANEVAADVIQTLKGER